GIPCFKADDVGKELLKSELKEVVSKRFGKKIYSSEGELNRRKLAEIVFNDPTALKDLNAIVHPAVAAAFNTFNFVILVTAPKELRLKRVVKRDGLKSEAVQFRMKNQWDDEKKRSKADFIIENESLKEAYQQFQTIYKILMELE
ncbi:MAG: dephospho-CoA kinase, partial [Flavobacteriaceae bacterium]